MIARRSLVLLVLGGAVGAGTTLVGERMLHERASASPAGTISLAAAGISLGAIRGNPCIADIDGSGDVGLGDIAIIIQNWGEPCFPDLDGDGFSSNFDCDDQNPNVYPGATEICNLIDDDCDNLIDEDVNVLTDPFNCGDCGVVCARPQAMYSCDAGVCIFQGCEPGWMDLDGDPENGCEAPFEIDLDADGWPQPLDCDDHDPDINPGAMEVCNTFDDNCNGQIDENAIDCIFFFRDDDADGVGDCGDRICACGPMGPYTTTTCDK